MSSSSASGSGRTQQDTNGIVSSSGQDPISPPGGSFMRSYFEWVTSRPVPVLVAAGLVGLVLAGFVPSLTRETSPDAFIPSDHPALAVKERVDAELGITEPIVVGIIGQEEGSIFKPEVLEQIRDLTEAIRALPGVDPDRVSSLATEPGVFFEDGEPGFELLMPEVPRDEVEAGALREDVLGYELYRGTIVSEDGSSATILVEVDDEVEAERLYRELRDLVTGLEIPGHELVVAGEAAVRAHMGRAVSDDALRMNFVCPIVMFLMIILAYRTARATILPICVIGGASVAALGTMSMAGVPVYIITNGIFVVIMALGVADSLHILGQYYEEQLDIRGRSRNQIVVDACMALWFPLLVTSLTDMAGFAALFVGGEMPPIRYFGLFTALGVLGALAYSYTVIPAGLAVLDLRSSPVFLERRKAAAEGGRLDWLGRMLYRLGGLVHRRRLSFLAAWAVIIVLSVWGGWGLIVNDARVLAFKDDHPIVRASRALNAHFDGTTELHVVLTAPSREELLATETLELIDEIEAFTESLPHVGGTHSIAGWVKRAHQKMYDDDPWYFAIPDDIFETMFYLDVLSSPGSPFANRLSEVLNEDGTRTNLIVRMQSSEYIHEREVVEAVERYLDEQLADQALEYELAGRVYLDYHWLRIVRTSHIRSVVLTSVCVLLLTAVMFRSVVAGLLCTLTIGVAVVFNYALMALGGVPLGVGTSMFASIAIGAGVNFPIHILDRLRHRLRSHGRDPEADLSDTLAFTGRALFFTAFVVASGFLLLMVSEFRTLVRFGFLIGMSTAVSFIASVTLLPALVWVLRPRFVWGRGDQDGREPAKPR